MINSISINSFASFDSSGVQITDLKKINFIYGANGSGKTTISNLIASSNDDGYQECAINWQHGAPLKTLVYNKRFRENNFGRGKIEGVFTLGQATRADIELIEQKQEKSNREQQKIQCRKEREAYLKNLSKDFPNAWKSVRQTVKRGSEPAYDQVCSALVDMHEAYSLIGSQKCFQAGFEKIYNQPHTAQGFDSTAGKNRGMEGKIRIWTRWIK